MPSLCTVVLVMYVSHCIFMCVFVSSWHTQQRVMCCIIFGKHRFSCIVLKKLYFCLYSAHLFTCPCLYCIFVYQRDDACSVVLYRYNKPNKMKLSKNKLLIGVHFYLYKKTVSSKLVHNNINKSETLSQDETNCITVILR